MVVLVGLKDLKGLVQRLVCSGELEAVVRLWHVLVDGVGEGCEGAFETLESSVYVRRHDGSGGHVGSLLGAYRPGEEACCGGVWQVAGKALAARVDIRHDAQKTGRDLAAAGVHWRKEVRTSGTEILIPAQPGRGP